MVMYEHGVGSESDREKMNLQEKVRVKMEALMNTASPLCFNRTDFTRHNFDVDIFLSSLRKRVSMDQISEDLRTYLKILQNAMIELINKDYADFVNLSSNLVNLRNTVEKLGQDLGSIYDEFNSSTSQLESAISSLDIHLKQKNDSRTIQSEIEDKMGLLNSLRNVNALLTATPWTKKKRKIMVERISQQLLGINVKLKRGSSNESYSAAYQQAASRFQESLDGLLSEVVENLTGDNKPEEKRGGGNEGEEEETMESQEDSRLLLESILTGYYSCDRRDAGLALFIALFLEPPLRAKLRQFKKSDPPNVRLNAVCDLLLDFSKTYGKLSSSTTNTSTTTATPGSGQSLQVTEFVNDAILTILLGCLDSEFTSVLIPTEPNSFHQSYNILVHFSTRWTNPEHRILRMCLNKFSLQVYFRLRTFEVTEIVGSQLTSENPAPVHGRSDFKLEASNALMKGLNHLWSPDVYLKPLISKFWDYTLQLLLQYKEWQTKVVELKTKSAGKSGVTNNNNNNKVNVTNGGSNGNSTIDTKEMNGTQSVMNANKNDVVDKKEETVESWKTLIDLVSDLTFLDTALFELAFQRIWPHVKSLGGDTRAMGECLSAGLREMKKVGAEPALVGVEKELGKETGSVLANGASEIPRQYRWTRKEAPTQPSLYVKTSFQSIDQFVDYAQSGLISEKERDSVIRGCLQTATDAFLESVKGVIDSVDKISSSLSRLKRGGKQSTAGLSSGQSLTDDQKIRMQLHLDLSEYRRKCKELWSNMNLSELDGLIVSSKPSTANLQSLTSSPAPPAAAAAAPSPTTVVDQNDPADDDNDDDLS